MQIFLETERLVLRQFTDGDVDNLVELDSDSDVMHFINGGRATARREIESDVLPTFLKPSRRLRHAAIESMLSTWLHVPSPSSSRSN